MCCPAVSAWAEHSGHGNKKKHFTLSLRASHLHHKPWLKKAPFTGCCDRSFIHCLAIQNITQFRNVGYSTQYHKLITLMKKFQMCWLNSQLTLVRMVTILENRNQIWNDLNHWKKIPLKQSETKDEFRYYTWRQKNNKNMWEKVLMGWKY